MNVISGGSPDVWAEAVAERFIAALQARPALRVCLPTGLTPVPIYDRVAAAVAGGRISFARAEIILLDEFGGVDPADPGRCERMLERYLLSRVDLPPGRFHAFDLTRDLDEVCREHEAVVGAGCDLALLGVGTNGHVGMNEPGSSPDSLTRRVDLAPATIAASARYFSHERLPTWGVTMGLATLRRSRGIWILASGSGKAAIVRDIVHGPVTDAVPATQFHQHPGTVLIADEAAAVEL
jgi:glucosamine-6-phosphate deaminase